MRNSWVSEWVLEVLLAPGPSAGHWWPRDGDKPETRIIGNPFREPCINMESLKGKVKKSWPTELGRWDAAYLGFSPEWSGIKVKSFSGEHLTTWVWNPECKLRVLVEQNPRDGMRPSHDHEYIRRITQCLEMNIMIIDIKTQYTGKTENCTYTV